MDRARGETLAILTGALLLETACGSIFQGTKQALPLASDPPGAMVTWSGQAVETPGKMVIPRKAKDVRLRFEKAGYDPCVVPLARRKNGWFWSNFVLLPVGFAAGAGIADSRHTDEGVIFTVEPAVVGLAAGAVLAGGGFLVDAGEGGGSELTPKAVDVSLKKAPERPEPVSPQAPLPTCSLRAPAKPAP